MSPFLTFLCCASILCWPPPHRAVFRLWSILSLTVAELQRQPRGRLVGDMAAATAPYFTGARRLKDVLSPFISPPLLRATVKAAIFPWRECSRVARLGSREKSPVSPGNWTRGQSCRSQWEKKDGVSRVNGRDLSEIMFSWNSNYTGRNPPISKRPWGFRFVLQSNYWVFLGLCGKYLKPVVNLFRKCNIFPDISQGNYPQFIAMWRYTRGCQRKRGDW